MTLDYNSFNLPVASVITDVKQKLISNNTLIISAPPGAGKSTLLPLALADEEWLGNRKILMLEPRRLAARSIASRMSDMIGEKVGESVGYRIRFESRVSEKTRIEILTEGILTRMLQSDNSLEGVGMVIFDEFHERSLFADVALALCREAQQILRPDLRIVIMSATLDMPNLSKLLDAPIVDSPGRQYPVEIINTGERDEMMLPELTSRVVLRALKEQKGDALVFLPGEGEIRRCESILKSAIPEVMIHPLYGQLPPGKQFAAIMPDRNGRRKVVLATSIAETSLTIEGVGIVVDCGYGRTMKFNPSSGLSRLETVVISRDMADQRTGRAGRLGPGVCYRMWSLADDERMADHRTPEIAVADLASLVLDMAVWGVTDIAKMTWLTPPPKGALNQATELLHSLDALNDGRITDYGRRMQKLPCHPRIAHMLICAEESGLLPLATDIAAILEERDPLPRESGIDINLRIEALRRYRNQKNDNRGFDRIEKIAASYRAMFNIKAENGAVNVYETGFLIVHAYPERIACARPGNNAQFQLSNGALVMAGHKDDLAYESWLAVSHCDARDGMGKIFMASPLNPQDLKTMVKEREVITWDSRKGGVVASREIRIGSIMLQSRALPSPDRALIAKAICDAVEKDGENMLDFNDDVVQWQCRVLSLKTWLPDEEWPDVTTETLKATCHKWLTPYLDKVNRDEDLKKIDLKEVLQFTLDYQLQQKLVELAPERIEVPSGSKIKLQYQANGSQPVLAVRLQEVFGLAETPRVNNGQMPVLMHLLSPGFKPVQVTSDLSSFWDNAYFDVRKELRSRYPKHVWPDDPWAEQAVRGTKRRK